MAQNVLKALEKKFGSAVLSTDSRFGDETAVVDAKKLVEIATWLRDDSCSQLDSPVFVTCIDHLDSGREPRFEVCYQLRSSTLKHRLRIKVGVPEASPKLPSLAGLWQGFEWQERETFDMYGIDFQEHPDLRRIYLYDEFVGYPLRKDYPKDKRQPLVRRDDMD